MLSKSFLVSAVVFALGLQVNAHAAISPALGVTGNVTRSDVQRPSTAKPCGNAALTAIDTSTPVNAAADGSITMNITNFNPGKDGSRNIKTVKINTGNGTSFKAEGAVTKNGDAAPSSTGSQQITVKLPAGTKCTGGKSGDLCLMSMTTDGGFGNCVVVKQGGAAAGNSTSAATGAVAAAGGAKDASNNSTKLDSRAVGTRAARAYLEGLIAEMK